MKLFDPTRHYHWYLFVLLFGCFSSAILGDSTAEALLLANLGADFVPYLFVANAFALFFCSAFILSIIDRTNRGVFFVRFLLIHAAILCCIRISIFSNWEWLFLPLFSYAYVSKTLLFLSFWTLTNDLIDSRKAETLFPFIAGGGTLGAIVIAYCIPLFVNFIRAENLILLWAGISFVLILIFKPLHTRWSFFFQPKDSAYARSAPTNPFRSITVFIQDMKQINREKVLLSISVVYFTLFFIIMSQHFTFYTHLKAHFSNAPDQARTLASFLGIFNGTSMLITFLMQNSLSKVILRRLGSTRTMYILPLVLFFVFGTLAVLGFRHEYAGAAITANVIFWGVVFGVGIRICFFDAFFSPDFQIFFSSLSHSIRGKGKLFVEGMIKPLAIFTSALWLVFVIDRIAFPFQMSILAILCIVLIYLSVLLKRSYTQQLTRHLEGFHGITPLETTDIEKSPHRTKLFQSIKSILHNEDPAVTRYAIAFLAQSRSKRSIQLLLDHIHTADNITRARVISALGEQYNASFRHLFIQKLNDSYYRVVANCIESLVKLDDTSAADYIRFLLKHPSGRVRANAIIYLWRVDTEPSARDRLRSVLTTMLYSLHDAYRASALYALGEITMPVKIDTLRRFYNNADIFSNRKIWTQFIHALSKICNDESLSFLVSIAGKVHIKRKHDIAHAIARMMRRGYPQDKILSSLNECQYTQCSILLIALNRNNTTLSREDQKEQLKQIADKEIEDIHNDIQAVKSLRAQYPHSEAIRFFTQVIKEECIDEKTILLLNIASLLDETKQIRKITHRLQNPDRHTHARALEVLDNTGYARINREIIRILEGDSHSPSSKTSKVKSVLSSIPNSAVAAMQKRKQRHESLQRILSRYKEIPNAWVRRSTEYVEHSLRK